MSTLLLACMHTDTCPSNNVARDVNQLEELFGDIVDQTSEIIIKEDMNVRDFKSRLTNLSVQDKKLHKKFLREIWPKLKDATLDDVLFELKMYWDFLNYTLLEHLVKHFGDEALKASMEDYKKRLMEFRCKTRLCDFAKHFKHIQKELERKELKIKKDKSWEECTLEDLENWRENITQKLFPDLPSFILELQAIDEGCVSITWGVPAVYATTLIEKMKTMDVSFCKEHGILSLHVDGVELYPSAELLPSIGESA